MIKRLCRHFYITLVMLASVFGKAQSKFELDPAKHSLVDSLEEGARPLFVLGDVDEDGKFDRKDRILIKQLAQGKMPSAVTCPAAADLNLDGRIDMKDLALADKMLRFNPVRIPALYAPYKLPCKFNHFFIASRADAHPGDVNTIYFLDAHLTASNTTVKVISGPATVNPTANGHGYVMQISSTAQLESMITILIETSRDRKKYRYYYSFPVL